MAAIYGLIKEEQFEKNQIPRSPTHMCDDASPYMGFQWKTSKDSQVIQLSPRPKVSMLISMIPSTRR